MNEFKLLLNLSVLPAVILGWYIYKKDTHKEPTKLLVFLIIAGALSCIPAALLEFGFEKVFPLNSNITSVLFHFIIGVGLIEELSKFFPAYLIGIKSKHFDDVYDAIVYTTFSALGFATFENLFYVFSGGVSTGIARMILAVPGHVAWGILMGYFLGIAYRWKIQNNKSLFIRNMIYSILIPCLYHGLYDFALMYGAQTYNVIAILGIMVLNIIITVYSFRQAKKIADKNEKISGSEEIKDIGPLLLCLVIILIVLFFILLV